MCSFELYVITKRNALSAAAAGELICAFGVKTKLFVSHLLWWMSVAGCTGELVINDSY